jgi:hypothetical protein
MGENHEQQLERRMQGIAFHKDDWLATVAAEIAGQLPTNRISKFDDPSDQTVSRRFQTFLS